MWDDGGMHGWGGWWGLLAMAGVLLLLVALAVLLALTLGRSGSQGPPPGAGPGAWPTGVGPSAAERLLDERFARGEIDEQEYRQRRSVLRGG